MLQELLYPLHPLTYTIDVAHKTLAYHSLSQPLAVQFLQRGSLRTWMNLASGESAQSSWYERAEPESIVSFT